MLLWTDAYMADTSHLTTIEHGAYLLILMAMWRAGGHLPNDDLRLARVARLRRDQWRKIAPTIREFLTVDGDAVTQKRLDNELKIARGRVENLALAGHSGGVAKALKYHKADSGDASGDATEMPLAKTKRRSTNQIHIKEERDSLLSFGGQNGHPIAAPVEGLETGVGGKRQEAEAIVDSFLAGWDALAAQYGLAACRGVTDRRRACILARAHDLVNVLNFPDAKAGFADLFNRIRDSPFLLGQSGNRAWRCDIDFAITESSFLKIMEGKYAKAEKPKRFEYGAQH
jgi:uncharacterized protein YdaU (DUF1376 family)